MANRFRTIEISNPSFAPEHIRFVTVKSNALKGRVDCTFFVPPQVPKITKKTPVVILLHGVYGSHWAWAYNINVHRIAAKLIASKEIAPMVLVMPSDGLVGDGSGYFNHGEKNAEGWIMKDVISLISEVVPSSTTQPNLFIAGLSMGGYGALRLMAKYPSIFKGASGLSSITSLKDLLPFIARPERRYYQENFGPEELITYLRHNAEHLPPFRFDCGEDDPLLRSNRKLHKQLLHEGISHEYQEFKGGHNNEYWNKNIATTLRFFSGLSAR